MKKTALILLVAIVGLWFAFSSFAPQAPLKDGLYLSYDQAGSQIRVTFTEISKTKFQATVTPGNSQKIVNKRLESSGGAVYEVGLLGPLWIPPSSVKVGGKAHGSSISEVKHWKEWDVGVVKASFGVGGALRGTWYYEVNTGFLVGGNKTTVMSSQGEGIQFVLSETNLEGL